MRFIRTVSFLITTLAYPSSVGAFVRQPSVSKYIQQSLRMTTTASTMAVTKEDLLGAQGMVDKLLVEKACGRYRKSLHGVIATCS